jgi:hypothetical protein
MNKKMRLLALAALTGTGFVATGCGSSPPLYIPPATPAATVAPSTVTPGCTSGSYTLPSGACVAAASYTSACQLSGGYMVSGGTLCKMVLSYAWEGPAAGFVPFSPLQVPPLEAYQFQTYNGLPILTPDNPAGPLAINTGIQLMAGDKVTVSASGGYSTSDTTSWGPFTIVNNSSSACTNISVNGVNSGNTVDNPNNNDPAELYGSDGTTAFAIGISSTTVMPEAGSLKLGFNAPISATGCSAAVLNTISVARCMDDAGNTPGCP